MAPPFSLLSAKWIPVKRADGSRDPIAPHEITSDHDSNPIVSFAWPRPDFDLAAHEFLIGLFAVAFPPKGQRWLHYFHIPPTLEELREVFQPYAAAFSLDGEGPRFLQDFSPLEAEPSPVEALFIEAPGAHTVNLNRISWSRVDAFACCRVRAPRWRSIPCSNLRLREGGDIARLYAVAALW